MTQGRHAEQGKGEEREDCKVCTCMLDGRAKRICQVRSGIELLHIRALGGNQSVSSSPMSNPQNGISARGSAFVTGP